MAASKYKAFISYKHSELGRRHAIALETGLKRYAKPLLQRPIKIFRDEKHMVPDNDLSSLITNGLDQSEFMIFIAEKGAANSPWCQNELEYWCGDLNRKDKLIIVHAADDLKIDIEKKTIAWDHTEALPSLLKTYISTIPFYVDLTWAQKKEEETLDHVRFKSAINLVTAKLRGVAPEELNDVELQVYRRNRRLRNWAIAVLSIMLIISIFASFFAYSQANEATIQRKNAEKQTKIAEMEKQRAIDSSEVAQEQREFARFEARRAQDSAMVAQYQRDLAKTQTKIAIAEREEAVRQTKEKEMRLSEVYWSYSKNFHDNQRHQLAQLYAVEAANLLPDRGYGVGYMSLSQNVSRYFLQNMNFEKWPHKKNIEFAKELLTSSRMKFDGEEIEEFSSWPDTLNSVIGANRFDSNQLIVSWHKNGTVVVRDVISFVPVFKPIRFRNEVTQATFHKDKLVIELKDEDEEEEWTEIWDPETSKRYASGDFFITDDFNNLILVNRLDNGKYTLKAIWDKSEKKSEKSIPINGRPKFVAFSNDLLAVVTVKYPNRISLYTPGNGNIPIDIYHPEPVRKIRISLDHQYIVVYGNNGTQYLWVKSPATNPNNIQHNFDNPKFGNGSFANNDNEFLLWGYEDFLLVDITTGQKMVIPSSLKVESATFSPNNKLIAAWDHRKLELWEKASLTKLFSVPQRNARSIVKFASDNSYLVQASGKEVQAISVADGKVLGNRIVLSSQADVLTISNNGEYWAVALQEGMLQLRDNNGVLLFQEKFYRPEAVNQCWFLNQDQYLLCVGNDTRLWDISSPQHTKSVLDLGSWDYGTLSDDGKKVMLWKDKKAQILELPTLKVLAQNLYHDFTLRGGCAVAGGKLFRTWDIEGNIYTWWSFSGSPMGQLPRPTGIVRPRKVVNSPSGNALIYFDYDEGPRTTYVPLTVLDGDFPEKFALLQSQALTGVTLNNLTSEVDNIAPGELKSLRRNYMRVLEEHERECAMSDNNLYSLLRVGWEQ